MCSLNNAINLYREEAEKEDNKRYIIVKIVNDKEIPLKDKKGKIEYFKDFDKADIDRIHYQVEYDELLKVKEI